jgi:hypothetical protein
MHGSDRSVLYVYFLAAGYWRKHARFLRNGMPHRTEYRCKAPPAGKARRLDTKFLREHQGFRSNLNRWNIY